MRGEVPPLVLLLLVAGCARGTPKATVDPSSIGALALSIRRGSVQAPDLPGAVSRAFALKRDGGWFFASADNLVSSAGWSADVKILLASVSSMPAPPSDRKRAVDRIVWELSRLEVPERVAGVDDEVLGWERVSHLDTLLQALSVRRSLDPSVRNGTHDRRIEALKQRVGASPLSPARYRPLHREIIRLVDQLLDPSTKAGEFTAPPRP